VSKSLQCCAAVATVLVAGANHALAQAWPSKPVRVVVPLSAGGGVDTVARVFAAKFSEAWKQPVVVDNRPGAGGTIGADLVAKAPKDGYTLLISASSHAVSPSLYPNLPYDALKDFAPATQIISTYLMLAVNPKVAANSVQELVALAKSQPGRLNFGSTGSGSAPHLVSELFKLEAGIDVVHVPYKGDAPLQPALIANDVQYAFLTPIAVMQHVKAGRLRAIAVTGTKRASIAPDVPTIAEAGLPNAEYVGWMGVFAPGGTPREALEAIAGETIRILKMPDIAPKVPGWGGEAAGTTPDEFAARYRSDVAKFARIVREARVPKVQ
jgi:tripartite-type tricarboxylate transporter receptor subunit TctC